MGRHLLSYLSLILCLVEISHAAELTGRDYWNSVLPKTPMPNAINALLHSGKQNTEKYHSDQYNHTGYDCPRKKYLAATSETQLYKNPEDYLFFLKKDFYPGKKMTLQFKKIAPNAPNFIPRSEANKLPSISSSKISTILDYYKIVKDTQKARAIKYTLDDCENTAISGDEYCATSLESMVDFVMSSLKTHNLRPLSTIANSPNPIKQEYTIIKSNVIAQNKLVGCHVEPYEYAVFFCHFAKSSKAYMVNLVGKDGDDVNAVAVCHMDTSFWNPKFFALQVLKVQPGSEPVCHFLQQDAVAWIRAM